VLFVGIQALSQSATNMDRERPLCRFFVMGTCKFGVNCSFSHDIPTGELAEARKKVPCVYFHRNKECRYGSRCVFSHDKLDSGVDNSKNDSIKTENDSIKTENDSIKTEKVVVSSASVTTCSYVEEENTCGICLDNIVQAGKRFGILSKCDHRFCIECLRKWRREHDTGKAMTNACPTCRVKSSVVIPTKKFIVGHEKEMVIEGYKKKMGSMPCRNFDGSIGSCPFGRNCFYAHFSWDGKDLKPNDEPRSRKKQKTVHPSNDLIGVLRVLMAENDVVW